MACQGYEDKNNKIKTGLSSLNMSRRADESTFRTEAWIGPNTCGNCGSLVVVVRKMDCLIPTLYTLQCLGLYVTVLIAWQSIRKSKSNT